MIEFILFSSLVAINVFIWYRLMKDKHVYLVTSGEQSKGTYSIEAVFTSLKQAKKYVSNDKRYYNAPVKIKLNIEFTTIQTDNKYY